MGITHFDEAPSREYEIGHLRGRWTLLGVAAGSITIGPQHVEVTPGKESEPPHCHSGEEEIFVVLRGDGTLVLGEEKIPMRPGHVVSRPPATRVPHMFRAGDAGLTYLAFGTREPADVCYYPRSNKIASRRRNDGSARAAGLLGGGGLTRSGWPAHVCAARACRALSIQPRWMRGVRVVQPRPAHVPGGRPEHVPAGGCAQMRAPVERIML